MHLKIAVTDIYERASKLWYRSTPDGQYPICAAVPDSQCRERYTNLYFRSGFLSQI
jgi:hypothetical protein